MPATFAAVSGCLSRPSRPKLSITTEPASWPAIVAATTPPAPSVRTVTSEVATKTAPMKPPTKYHQGTPFRPSRWAPPEATATTNSAAVPTMNEIVAAANVPTAPPSLELIGGCTGARLPPQGAGGGAGALG